MDLGAGRLQLSPATSRPGYVNESNFRIKVETNKLNKPMDKQPYEIEDENNNTAFDELIRAINNRLVFAFIWCGVAQKEWGANILNGKIN